VLRKYILLIPEHFEKYPVYICAQNIFYTNRYIFQTGILEKCVPVIAAIN
jgi:hypothetical protein